MPHEFSTRTRVLIWLASGAVFLPLALATGAVWRAQMLHQHSLLLNHVDDVCVQAARRLEVFVESHLSTAEIFAERWATHESKDYSRHRFEEFATVILTKIPHYVAVGWVLPDNSPGWSIARPGYTFSSDFPGASHLEVIEQAAKSGDTTLSAPILTETGKARFLICIPLRRDQESLGYMIIESDANTLLAECFRARIRSEFNFWVRDGVLPLSGSGPDMPAAQTDEVSIRASQPLKVRNREWRLTIVPKHSLLEGSGWRANVSVPTFGLILSVGIAWLVHLLLFRMQLYREARDRALEEITKREIFQRKLMDSEARYRSVFESSTDGLLILTPTGKILEANSAASTMHGYPPEGITGMKVEDLIDPAHRYQAAEFIHQLERHGTVRLSSVDVRKDGTRLDVEVRGARFAHAGEQRLLAIITDVSERRRSEHRLALLSRKVLLAQEEERARLSRELHDELGQMLTALHLELAWVRQQARSSEGQTAMHLDKPVELVESSAEMLRRICRGLRPPALDDLGLESAVRLLINDFQERTSIQTDAEIRLGEDGDSIPGELSLCTYRILQESLNNVSRHAQARQVDISLILRLTELCLSVYDDGQGFEMSSLEGSQGSGLAGMSERAHLVSGVLEVRSAPHQGTRVTFRVTIPELKGGK